MEDLRTRRPQPTILTHASAWPNVARAQEEEGFLATAAFRASAPRCLARGRTWRARCQSVSGPGSWTCPGYRRRGSARAEATIFAIHPAGTPAATAADCLELLALGAAIEASGWPDTGGQGSGGWRDRAFTHGQWIELVNDHSQRPALPGTPRRTHHRRPLRPDHPAAACHSRRDLEQLSHRRTAKRPLIAYDN